MKLQILIENHIKSNFGKYMLLMLFFIIGIGLGAFTINGLSSVQRNELTNYMQGFLGLIDAQTIDTASLFRISAIYNLKIILVLWLLGATVIGIPFIFAVIGIRGFITGFTAGFIIRLLGVKGLLFTAIIVLLKEMIIVPCMFALGVNGINFSQNIIRRKNINIKVLNAKENFKSSLTAYCAATLFYSAFLFAGILVEVYLIPILVRMAAPILTN
ncbi:MAG: stage II sporulation protein M [Eubacteriales bacterium]|nr:stage II sporulation protein M [Eubacteriales bacterium]